MGRIRKLPTYANSLGGVILSAKEAVLAPMRPKLREYNLSEPQWRVMRVINDIGPTDATTLSAGGLLHAPSVTRILKDLDERSLILREPDPKDGRRTQVVLSEEGRAIVADISRFVLRLLRDYSEAFGPDRLKSLTDELRALSLAVRGIQ